MSFRKYTQYKSSHVEWLGEIPAHWDVFRLKDIAEIMNGYPFDSKNFEPSGDFPLLRIRDLNCAESAIRYSGEYVASAEVTSADVLVGMDGDFEVGRWFGREPALLNQRMCCVRTPCSSLSTILEHALPTPLKAINEITYSTTVKHLSSFDVAKIRIALPGSDAELEALAVFLYAETRKIDALIAEQEKLLELLAEKRQATILHAVTRGLNRDVPMKDSGAQWLGMVPKHWEVIPLKYLVTLRSGGTPSKDNLDYWDGDVPWASAKDLKVEKLSDTADHITKYAVEAGAAALVPAGAILVVVRGMILARTFPVVETLAAMAINQDLKAVIPRKNLSAPFLALLLRGSEGESLQRLDEAGHGTKALRMDAWTSMQMPIPPLDEQADIAEFVAQEVTRLDGIKAEAALAIDLLKERRSALISAAITGKIDVREHSSALAAAA
ncbi:type I restriction-modification methylase S subunit [Pandoraea anapnoica]|uniref:Type I restriction-modification methylase S subunit n=1 Tax=Pandoraea anapnoica TaxID=2508301 RepID=A0A5E4ZYP5_9BURK|nr:restriction endonuclease subunit S [Pandoraea anapnoica]VVE66444.1 type I restriction-modification methylase S subunit [Pandoraea anapnoica]